MKSTPRNKMITNEDEIVKDSESQNVPDENLGTQVKSFYFPHLQKTVYAETYEDAVAIINKEKEQ